MNTIYLNTIGTPKASGGNSGGGGTPINNQEKSVDITENGTTEVRYDAGYTGLEKVSVKVAIPNEEKTIDITENGTTEVVAANGFLSKVTINTNVASSGGVTFPINDGETHLLVSASGYSYESYDVGIGLKSGEDVVIDWGDGIQETLPIGTTRHSYGQGGTYIISIITNGKGMVFSPSLSEATNSPTQQVIQKIEIGNNASLSHFGYCKALNEIIISPKSYPEIGNIYYTTSLQKLCLPEHITSVGRIYSSNLDYIEISKSIETLGGFDTCKCLTTFDCRKCQQVPSLTSAFNNMSWGVLKIIVPDALYDEWIAATNWSSQASRIVKASEFNG